MTTETQSVRDPINQRINDILYVYNISGQLSDYSDIPETRQGALLYPHMATPLDVSDSEEVYKQKRREYLKQHFKPSEAAIQKADQLLNEKIDALNEMDPK